MSNGVAVVIVGVARGGTSFVASICAHLGIPMGRRGPRFEHRYLQRAVLKDDWEAVEKIATVTSEHLPLWGWKMPLLIDKLREVSKVVPACKYICVVRNPVGLLPRRVDKSDTQGAAYTINRALNHYLNATQFFKSTKSPVLFLNFDHARLNVEDAVSEIAEFCGIKDIVPRDIVAKIDADQAAYKKGEKGIELNEPMADRDHPLSKAVRKIARRHDLIDAPADLIVREQDENAMVRLPTEKSE